MPATEAVTLGADAQTDWPEVLDRYGVQYLVLDTQDDGELLRQFRAAPDWLVDLKVRGSVLLARTGMRQETPSTAGSGHWQGSFDR